MAKLQAPFYAGIGSRDTPEEIQELMQAAASELADLGWILRSGHAEGADLAFERGSKGQNQIFLPWADFNYDLPQAQGLSRDGHFVPIINNDALRIAQAFHPAWDRCTTGARSMHCRNAYQVLGPGLGLINTHTVSRFVLCWTKDGKASGGTGQAIRIAEGTGIPVFNLFHADALEKLGDFLRGQ